MKLIINNQSDLGQLMSTRLILEILIKHDLKTNTQVFHDYKVGETSYTAVFHKNKLSYRFNIYNNPV